MTGKTIQIENVGPIERLSIPLPEAGVVVLRGRNGSGKSHALQAVDSLVGGRGRPPCRDGARRAVVEGYGVRLTIGRSTRRTGEAEVVTLEGRLDISQLVQPPIKDPEAADRQRTKALIQLSGAEASPELFRKALPEGLELGELVSPADLERDDPVVLAGKIKRALEAEARRHERGAEDAAAKAAALEEQLPPGRDDLPPREQVEAKLQESLLRLRELETRHEQSQRQARQIEQAKARLAQLRREQPGEVDALQAEAAQLDEKIRKLQQALAVAQERRRQVGRQLEQAQAAARQIEELEALVRQLPEQVDEAELAQLRQRVDKLRALHRQTIQAEARHEAKRRIEELRQAAQRESSQATRLRESAKATDEVLSDLVGQVTEKLRVEAGRLVCDTDRGVEPFAELSPGERWRIALEIAAEQVGPGGLVTVPQEAWEALDPVHRQEVAEIARRVGVVILTAEAAENERIEPQIV